MFRQAKSGNWICYICNDLNRNPAEKTMCPHGHRRLVGQDCKVCRSYQGTPWLKELDTNGEALCPRGHRVSHADKSVMYTKYRAKRRARKCRVCHEAANKLALSLAPGKSLDPM